MKPTEQLMKEHRLIEKILEVLGSLAADAERGIGPDPERARDTSSFFREFADRCHHGKEEKHLFPRLGEHGYGPTMGPVAVMLGEHEQGRAYLRAVGEALDDLGADGARKRYASAARGYIELLAPTSTRKTISSSGWRIRSSRTRTSGPSRRVSTTSSGSRWATARTSGSTRWRRRCSRGSGSGHGPRRPRYSSRTSVRVSRKRASRWKSLPRLDEADLGHQRLRVDELVERHVAQVELARRRSPCAPSRFSSTSAR